MFKKAKAIILCVVILALQVPTIAHAASSDDYVKLSKVKSYNENGLYYMVFKVKNCTSDQDIYCSAKLINSAGKETATWNGFSIGAGKSKQISFNADYTQFPSGKYSFRVYVTTSKEYFTNRTISGYEPYSWYWSYTINNNSSKISIKSVTTVIGSDGIEKPRFNIQCTNIKGKALTLEIYDSDGDLVYKDTGPKRKTNNEVGWFTWDGWPSEGGLRCESGKFTVKVYYSGGTPIQKSYNLSFEE